MGESDWGEGANIPIADGVVRWPIAGGKEPNNQRSPEGIHKPTQGVARFNKEAIIEWVGSSPVVVIHTGLCIDQLLLPPAGAHLLHRLNREGLRAPVPKLPEPEGVSR